MSGVDPPTVERVDYTIELQRLEVWYKDGSRRTFFAVPPDVYQALLATPSLDAFVKLLIHDRYPDEGA